MSNKEDGFLFADLGELKEMTSKWRSQGDDIKADGHLLTDAFSALQVPSGDVVTMNYVSAVMSEYVDDYVHKLLASQQLMANTTATSITQQSEAFTLAKNSVVQVPPTPHKPGLWQNIKRAACWN